jgi:hypothetical protein
MNVTNGEFTRKIKHSNGASISKIYYKTTFWSKNMTNKILGFMAVKTDNVILQVMALCSLVGRKT